MVARRNPLAALYSSADEQANSPVAATPRDTGVMDTHSTGSISPSSTSRRARSSRSRRRTSTFTSTTGRRTASSSSSARRAARATTTGGSRGCRSSTPRPARCTRSRRRRPDRRAALVARRFDDRIYRRSDERPGRRRAAISIVVPAAGGAPRDVTPAITSSIASFSWTRRRRRSSPGVRAGQSQFATLDAKTGALDADLVGRRAHVARRDLRRRPEARRRRTARRVAAVRESFAMPPEIWVGAPGTWTQMTHVNDGVGADRRASGVERELEERQLQRSGLSHLPDELRFVEEVSDDRAGARRPVVVGEAELLRAGFVRGGASRSAATSCSCPIRAAATDRAKRSRAPTSGFRPRRSAGHHGRRRRSARSATRSTATASAFAVGATAAS